MATGFLGSNNEDHSDNPANNPVTAAAPPQFPATANDPREVRGKISRYITHDAPVWRSERSYIAMVNLEPFGFSGDFEQLWLQESAKGYIVSCIPFRVYGIALGDIVTLDSDDRVKSVSAHSGRRVLRVLFAESALESAMGLRDSIEGGILSEWNGERHVAIDVPPGREAVASGIEEAISRGLNSGLAFWEWGDAIPFGN